MFGFRKKKKKDKRCDDLPVSEIKSSLDNGSDVDISFPIDGEIAEQLDSIRTRSVTVPAADIDAMSVIEGFLSSENANFNGIDVPEGAEVIASGEEEIVEDIDEMDRRLYALNDIMLHYYLMSCRSWLEGIFTALDEVPALCLSIPGSPVEYIQDTEQADDIAEKLGYGTWDNLSSKMSEKMLASPFLKRFAEYTLEFANTHWFDDIKFVSPEDYAEAIVNEIRANAPGTKASALSFIERVFETLPAGALVTDDGTEGVICGIETVDSNWMPNTISIMRKEDWDKKQSEFKAYASRKHDMAKSDGSSAMDDDIMSLVYLQSYTWSNRSWNKATELAEDFLNSCFTFCMSCISPEYKVVDIEKVEENASRLDEIAHVLMNDDGEIELRQIRTGSPQDLSTLDETSREFVLLNKEQAQTQFVSNVNQIISNLMPSLAGLQPTVTDMAIDEILTCVWADSDLANDSNQLKVMQELHMKSIETLKAKAKTYKSYWKKYLAKNEDAAQAIKEGYAITAYEDGKLRFLAADTSAMLSIEHPENVEGK